MRRTSTTALLSGLPTLLVLATAFAQDAGPPRARSDAGAAPRPTSPSRAVQIAVGPSHTCARMTDGTLRCWGENDYGQLGDGTLQARTTPVVASALSGAVVDVQAGSGFTCARRADGTAACWGYNAYGEVGSGTASERVEDPTPVRGLRGIAEMRVGSSTVCTVIGGRLHCWGRLEPNWDRPNPTPRFVQSPPRVIRVSVDDFACVVTADHSLSCWGANHARRPTSMGLSGVTDVTQGGLGGCALLADGTVHCWGWNDSGQLGRAYEHSRDEGFSREPIAIAGVANARRIVAGSSHRCALLANGSVSCWGAQWGNPSFPRDCLQQTRHSSGGGSARQWQYCPTPTIVSELRDVVDLDAHDTRSCALARTGRVWCWGPTERLSSVTP